MKLPLLLQLAALTHIGLLAAGLLMPRTVGLPQYLATLPPFIRQLFWTYYTFIGLCLVSFGLGTFFLAEELASGTPLARAVCGFLTVFWTIRLVAAHAVFDLRPYVTTRWHRVGLFLANTVFGALPFVYAWVAWKGGRL
jgi:hypothetical protein